MKTGALRTVPVDLHASLGTKRHRLPFSILGQGNEVPTS